MEDEHILKGLLEGKTYREIAEEVGLSIGTIFRHQRYYSSQGILKPRRGEEAFRDFWDDVLCFQYSLSTLAERVHITEDAVVSRFRRVGITEGEYSEAWRETRGELREQRAAFVTVLAQYHFEKKIAEEGFDRALAWRVQNFFHIGKAYSLETLDKLIRARREGNGYRTCAVLGRIARTLQDAEPSVPDLRRILSRALHDVSYKTPVYSKNIFRKVSLSPDEERTFVEMYTERKDMGIHDIGLSFGYSSSWVDQHARELGYTSRPIHKKGWKWKASVSRNKYSSLEFVRLLNMGMKCVEIQQKMGLSTTTFYRYKKKFEELLHESNSV